MTGIRRVSIGTWVLIAACCVVAGVLLYKDANTQDWAGWAQALGSAGAIWGSFSLARQSYKEQRDLETARAQGEDFRRRMQEAARLEIVLAIAYDALQALNEALRQARNEFDKDYFQLRSARLEDVQYMLRGLLLDQLPDRTVEGLLLLQQSVSRTLRDVSKWYDAKQSYPLAHETLVKLVARVDRAKVDALSIVGFHAYWSHRVKRDRQDGYYSPNGLGGPPVDAN